MKTAQRKGLRQFLRSLDFELSAGPHEPLFDHALLDKVLEEKRQREFVSDHRHLAEARVLASADILNSLSPMLLPVVLHVVAGSIRVCSDALKAEALSIGREHLLEDLRDIFIRSEWDFVQRSSYTLASLLVKGFGDNLWLFRVVVN